MTRWAWGALFSAGVVTAAWGSRALTLDGALAAWWVGWLAFGSGGWVAAAGVLAFFVPSSLLSYWQRSRKHRLRLEFAKGERRDAGQVLANGGVATLAAVLAWMGPPDGRAAAVMGFLGALAAAAANTPATEVGSLFPKPRHILSGRRVPPGTSGAVSPWGIVAGEVGALVVALAMWGLAWQGLAPGAWNTLATRSVWNTMTVAGLAGLGGNLADSLLGAGLQGVYRCPRCHRETERRIHGCGTPTQHVRGIAWVSNDLVNFLGTLTGSIIAVLLSTF